MGRVASSSKIKSSKKKKTEARRGKRSKKINKSKKHLRGDDDDSSSYSDDDSTSSMSVSSSSSSEENYKSRKAQSRKKRALRRSRSKDSKKINRGVKRKHRDSESTKKQKYKKSRRYDSISCCSTSSNSEESEFEKRRGRSRERGKYKGKIGNRKRKNRSLSCSSLSRLSDASDDKAAVNPTRLKSVITVAERVEERDEILTDEIVYEHDDDYPSRSNESNDCANKRDLDSKKENESGATSAPSVDVSSDGQDLETILRQKALENLKKFRGGKSQTNDGSVLVSAEKLSGPELSKDSLVLSTRTEEKILDEKESVTQAEGKILEPGSSLSESSLSKSRVESLGAGEKIILDGKTRGIEPVSESSLSKSRLKDSLGAGERKIVDGKNRGTEPGSSQSESNLSKSRLQDSLGGGEKKILQDSENESNLSKSNKESLGVNDGGIRVEATNEGVHGSSEGQNQVKDSSQFQQKTMSVMRGGEMVQVSYKVYIPKKAPGLARRQLRR